MCCNPNAYDESNPLLGVVLSGGNSTRMGEDKGLLVKDGEAWAKRSFDKLECLGIPAVISVNPSQETSYSSLVPGDLIITDKIGLKGPLEGILSVHNHFPNHDLVVIASDLPDISTGLLKDLVNIYDERAGEHDFIVYSIKNEVEPLVGIYTSEGLNKIFSLHISGQLEKFSMKYILDLGNTFSVDLPENKWKELKNYNSKEDLG